MNDLAAVGFDPFHQHLLGNTVGLHDRLKTGLRITSGSDRLAGGGRQSREQTVEDATCGALQASVEELRGAR